MLVKDFLNENIFQISDLIRRRFECVTWTVTPEFLEVLVERVLGELAHERRRRDRLVLGEVLAPTPGEKVFLFAY